ncbi:potassium-transporting ATPase subunit KdpA [Clostridium sp. Marseille-Q7071]
MDILQIVVTLILFMLLIVPVGTYLYKVASGEGSFVDPVFDKVDNFIFKITKVKKEEMNWKKYATSLLLFNGVMILIAYLILRIQNIIFLNPNGIDSMEQSLSFNTAISFITNTNLQNYSGESALSYFSQMSVITFLMFTSASTGLSAALAFIRGLAGHKKTVGNFFVDLVRIITRVALPLSIFVALLFVWQGVPQTFSPNITVNTIEGKFQDIALGPVASLESIKHIGTNGGGFFGANSSHPFENPTPITNLIEILSMMVIPGSLVYTFGLMIGKKKEGWTIFKAMAILLLIAIPICYYAEMRGNPELANVGLSQIAGNMEGKEVRFGIAQSSLFTTITTAFTTGTVNNMHDSLTPLGGMVALWNMMLNVVFGGNGVGLMGMIMYAILAVFLCGLMVGRTPEFLRKKIEGKEIKLIALAIIIHPLIILMPSAIALSVQSGLEGITNHGFHGLTQVLYQYTSSAANNGSGFEGLMDNTIFWNSTTGIVMLLGRYMPMILLLAVAGSFTAKKALPENNVFFRTDNGMFVVIIVAVVVIIGALTFLPALALGPIAEHLTLGQ